MKKKKGKSRQVSSKKHEGSPLVKKIKKAVVFITLVLASIFFYQAYFGS